MTPRLGDLAALARDLGAVRLAEDADALAERLREGRFYVVCVGQFKRGKSTLLNALIGTEILPTGVVPLTSVVTVVRHGERVGARVRLTEEDWRPCDPSRLSEYVTEEKNPGNRKGVGGVEVFVPSPLLANGMSLVDTPGVGSVMEGAAIATEAFVPHIDAAVVVLGSDPPITADELALVQRIEDVTPRLIVVLNKADRVSDVERHEARAFAERVLRERLGRAIDPVLSVSATQALRDTGRRYDWDRLVTSLETLARSAGAPMIRAAEARGVDFLCTALRNEIDAQLGALLRPLEESETRIAQLRAGQRTAGESLRDLGHRLVGAEQELLRRFTADRDSFFARVIPEATVELEAGVSADTSADANLRDRAVERATMIALRCLERWEQDEAPHAEALYRQATARFVGLVNEVTDDLVRIPGFGHLPHVPVESGFRAKRQMRYTRMLHTAPVSYRRRATDALRSFKSRRRAVVRDAVAYLGSLIEVNSARIKNDFSDRVVESRRSLERDLSARLAELLASAERALNSARDARARGEEGVRARRERLEAQRARLASLCRGA
jgi:GTP-binding protein EngB required for normal cell division